MYKVESQIRICALPHNSDSLSCFVVQIVESVVGIHIGVSALTWAHIDYSGKLLHWDLYSLEFGNRKLHVTSLFGIVSVI
jgi:hypothetical protein